MFYELIRLIMLFCFAKQPTKTKLLARISSSVMFGLFMRQSRDKKLHSRTLWRYRMYLVWQNCAIKLHVWDWSQHVRCESALIFWLIAVSSVFVVIYQHCWTVACRILVIANNERCYCSTFSCEYFIATDDLILWHIVSSTTLGLCFIVVVIVKLSNH